MLNILKKDYVQKVLQLMKILVVKIFLIGL